MEKLLLHTCCAPCLSSVEEQLRADYDIAVFWYNPNIYPALEHDRRLSELIRFCNLLKLPLIDPGYSTDRQAWTDSTVDYQRDPEGQRRCHICYRFRLSATLQYALSNNFSIIATTLTVSPHKPIALVNKAGRDISKDSSVKFLEADFKKNNGYLRSIELSKQYSLYRQDYCGCIHSLKARDQRQTNQAN